MIKVMKRIGGYFPKISVVFFSVGFVSAIINIAYIISTPFADFTNRYISHPLRSAAAFFTSFIPFSLAEFLVISAPITVAAIVVFICKKSVISNRHFIRSVIGILSVAVLLYSMFTLMFGAGYRTTSLDKKLGLDRRDVSADDLGQTMAIVIEHLNDLADDIIYDEVQGSVRPYSHDRTVELCLRSYESLSEKYDFIPKLNAPVKQIVLSEPMTYTHISGMYTFFTGESNVNTNYPYFVNVFSVAHEMAHQRGIARENEANFIAFLVCINSDDPFMQYAGYLNMYEYLASPLYKASPMMYRTSAMSLSEYVKYDLACYSDFFDRYRDSVAADVSDAVNNTYLQIQGTEGSRSYGMVVDLAVAYYRPMFEE